MPKSFSTKVVLHNPLAEELPNKDVDVVAATSHKSCAEKLHKEGGGVVAAASHNACAEELLKEGGEVVAAASTAHVRQAYQRRW